MSKHLLKVNCSLFRINLVSETNSYVLPCDSLHRISKTNKNFIIQITGREMKSFFISFKDGLSLIDNLIAKQ